MSSPSNPSTAPSASSVSSILQNLSSSDPSIISSSLTSLKPLLSEPIKEAAAVLDALGPLMGRDVEAAKCVCNLLFKNQNMLKAAGPR